ncbi:MAG: hypothetical protein Q4C67_07465 [Deinococcus sp.]|nr:hypothetical protein [Deinococcus sp.]
MVTETRPLAQGILALHLQQAADLRELSGADPLLTARLAAACGQAELARALLARSGGLFDREESARLLSEPCPPELVARAAQVLRTGSAQPETSLSDWTETQREMYVRVLASLLIAEPAPLSAAQVGGQQPAAHMPPGLWRLAALPERQRWAAGRRLLQQLSPAAPVAPGTPAPVQWANASWGGRWGLRLGLAGAEGVGAEVVSLEHVVASLSAAWSWGLPELPPLLSRPLLMEGLETLPADRLELVTSLLADASALFGWTVIALPAIETPWPAAFQPLPAEVWAAPEPESARSVTVTPPGEPLTLPELAAQLEAQGGRTLVVLYSRASAARLAGMLPGSVLLSSSLSRAHLDRRMSALAEQAAVPDLTVIATTLPSTPVGEFDRVYHLLAPLTHLTEAAQLSRGPLTLFTLRDVALPQSWEQHSRLTARFLAEGDPMNDPAAQRRYMSQLRALEQGGRLGHWLGLRREQQFAALASELSAQPASAVPVLIGDGPGKAAIARSREQGWLSRRDLRYAAWVTPMEAQRAVRLGDAEPFGSGWALVWCGDYDDTYGLAWPLVQAEQQRSDE